MIKIKIYHDILDYCINLLCKGFIKNFTTISHDFKVGDTFSHIKVECDNMNGKPEYACIIIFNDVIVNTVDNDVIEFNCYSYHLYLQNEDYYDRLLDDGYFKESYNNGRCLEIKPHNLYIRLAIDSIIELVKK